MSTPPISPTFQAMELNLLALIEDDDQERIPPAAAPQAPAPQVPKSQAPAKNAMTPAYEYTTKISNCSSIEEAEKIMVELKQKGIRQDSYHFNALMNIYARYKPAQAPLIISRMEASGIKPTLNTYNILIDAYAECKNLEKAQEVFNNILPKKRLKPDVVTVHSLLKACRNCKEFNLAKNIFAENFNKDASLKPNKITLSLMVQTLCTSTSLEEAYSFVKSGEIIVKPDFEIYKILINHYADRKCPARVRDLYQEIPQEIQLNAITYFIVLKSYAMLGDKSGAEKIYNTLLAKQNLPTTDFVSSEIEALVDAKQIAGAEIIYSFFYNYQVKQGRDKEMLRCERMSGNVAYLFMRSYLASKKGKDTFVVFLNKEDTKKFTPLLCEHHAHHLTWDIRRNNKGYEVFIKHH